MYIPLPFHETTTSDAVSTGALPDPDVVVDLLTEVYDHFRPLEEGAVADYIPALANVDPSLFAVSIVGVAGGSYSVGDAQFLFSLQSISKAFVFALVCDAIGHDEAQRPRATGHPVCVREARTEHLRVEAGWRCAFRQPGDEGLIEGSAAAFALAARR